MWSRRSWCICFFADALLLRGAVSLVRAQDANREVVETRSDTGGVVDRLAKKSGDFKDAFDNAVSHSIGRTICTTPPSGWPTSFMIRETRTTRPFATKQTKLSQPRAN
jgi:hypothetical protein